MTSNTGNVGGEEVDAVTVEVAPCSVVVLGGAWIGVPGKDLGISQRHPCVEGVGDGGMAQRVGTDVAGGMPASFVIRTTMR